VQLRQASAEDLLRLAEWNHQLIEDEQSRRKGLGRRAIALFCRKLVPDGATLSLDVIAHNQNGLAFWRALGFREHKVSFRLCPSQP
jgi:ribosomal protein S18 acetylase RimI-like enzyme